jgi:NADH dehydrogenase
MFAPGDVLLGTMLRQIDRYPVFPMFGDGSFRLSPIAASDVARAVVRAAAEPPRSTVDLGGPVAYRYRDVTDRMFALLGRTPRYWHLSPAGAKLLAGLLQSLGSTLLYRYEVEWLLSDTLALAPSPFLDGPLERVEPYLEAEAARISGRPVPKLGPLPAARQV